MLSSHKGCCWLPSWAVSMDLIWEMAGAATSIRSFFPNPTADMLQIVLSKVIVCFVLLRAAEGVADVVQGLPRSVHGSHQLSIFLCDLSYWRAWKLLRWDEPRRGPPRSPGWSACQRAASPSASVSHKTSNLFGRQMTLLSLVSRGPLRVRRILFGSWGSRGDPDFSDQTHGPLQMWGYRDSSLM